MTKLNINPVRTARSLAPMPISHVTPYLPSNYTADQLDDGHVVIKGRDKAGWTLDGYVIPRLASGLLWFDEVRCGSCGSKTSDVGFGDGTCNECHKEDDDATG